MSGARSPAAEQLERPGCEIPLIATAALVLVFLTYVVLGWLADDSALFPAPTPTPDPRLTVEVRSLSVVPPAQRDVKRQMRDGLLRDLGSLYKAAFIDEPPRPTPPPSPATPAPIATPQLPLQHFSDRAGRSLAESPGVFRRGDVHVRRAHLDAVATIIRRNREPLEAVVRVRFTASGAAADRPVDMEQKGTLRLGRRDGRWIVTGFDLSISTAPAPTPSPSSSPSVT